MAKKSNKKVALYPYVEGNQVKFKIVGDGYEKMPARFNPTKGTSARAVATCLVCGAAVDANTTRNLFQQNKADQRMIAFVSYKPGTQGKKYRIANEKDMQSFKLAEEYLKEKREKLMMESGIDPVPDEPLPPTGTLGFRIQRYNMNNWGDLFNSRQKLALITFVEKVRKVYNEMTEQRDPEYAKVILCYLALGIDRLADFGSTLCLWNYIGGRGVVHTFGRHALPMVWDYPESNPFNPIAAGWITACEKNEKWIEYASSIANFSIINQSSATNLTYKKDYFDAIFTDPPYYDNVPYSYLSDFFYVWLKRILLEIFPELFTTPLSPKTNEIVAYYK